MATAKKKVTTKGVTKKTVSNQPKTVKVFIAVGHDGYDDQVSLADSKWHGSTLTASGAREEFISDFGCEPTNIYEVDIPLVGKQELPEIKTIKLRIE